MRISIRIALFVLMSLLLIGTIHGAKEIHGSIYTKSGVDIYDNQLRQLLDHYINTTNAHSTLVILTECYGGDKMDDLASRPNTTVLSATSEGEYAYYGGYDNDAANALKPGVGRTSDDVHAAGVTGKATNETPKKQGPAASLEPTDPDGVIKSRHVLVFAGSPNSADNSYVNKIRSNFQGQTATTVTAAGGNGTTPYNYPGTLEGMKSALAAIKAQMNPNEQFILFVTDHGDQDVVDPAPLNLGDSSQSIPLTYLATTQTHMQNEPNNIPRVCMFSPGDYVPEPVTVYTCNQTFSNVTFDWAIDLNGDGDLLDEGEGWQALVEIDENLINWDGEVISVAGSDLYLASISLESGGIPKVLSGMGKIPTLGEWAMIIFCVLLFGWMAWVIVRRKKTADSPV